MWMFESYIEWIKKKFWLTNLTRNMQVKEGEVYWCSLGLNVGDEENGKGKDFRRPVLVLRKFNNSIFIGVPLTTKNKENKYYTKILLKDNEVSAIISQLRVLDVKRLDEKIGYVPKLDFQKVKQTVKDLF
jgi:mRNA interferase MazF